MWSGCIKRYTEKFLEVQWPSLTSSSLFGLKYAGSGNTKFDEKKKCSTLANFLFLKRELDHALQLWFCNSKRFALAPLLRDSLYYYPTKFCLNNFLFWPLVLFWWFSTTIDIKHIKTTCRTIYHIWNDVHLQEYWSRGLEIKTTTFWGDYFACSVLSEVLSSRFCLWDMVWIQVSA